LKLKTHVFSAFVLYTVFDMFFFHKIVTWNPLASFTFRLYMFIAAYFFNYLIDIVGHSFREYNGRIYPARNKLHSLPVMTGISIALYSPTLYYYYFINRDIQMIWITLLYAFLLALVHFVEDAVTEAGVYVGDRKVRLPVRIRYDDPYANGVAKFVFLGLLAISFIYYINNIGFEHVDLSSLVFFIASLIYLVK